MIGDLPVMVNTVTFTGQGITSRQASEHAVKIMLIGLTEMGRLYIKVGNAVPRVRILDLTGRREPAEQEHSFLCAS